MNDDELLFKKLGEYNELQDDAMDLLQLRIETLTEVLKENNPDAYQLYRRVLIRRLKVQYPDFHVPPYEQPGFD
jgi:hypothetical protein